MLSSRSLRLMTVRNRKRSISAPRTASVTRRGDERDDERPVQLAIDLVGDEAAEHVHLAVREIEHVHQREDQRQAERDQRVLGAEIEPVGDDLFHAASVDAKGAFHDALPRVAKGPATQGRNGSRPTPASLDRPRDDDVASVDVGDEQGLELAVLVFVDDQRHGELALLAERRRADVVQFRVDP